MEAYYQNKRSGSCTFVPQTELKELGFEFSKFYKDVPHPQSVERFLAEGHAVLPCYGGLSLYSSE